MPETTFTLRLTEDYIELTKLLKVVQLAQSGGHAKLLVEEGSVRVNGAVEYRKRNKLRAGDWVEVGGHTVLVQPVEAR